MLLNFRKFCPTLKGQKLLAQGLQPVLEPLTKLE